MQSKGEDDVKPPAPYRYYIEKAYSPPLQYGVRAPRVPNSNQYAPAWEVPEELAVPQTSRALKQIYRFKDLGQNLELNCYKYFQDVRPEFMIDWNEAESKNIRLPADGIHNQPQEQAVDDLRTFFGVVYGSIIVTAMEMARLIYGGPYNGSYRYSRESTINVVRGACWNVLPYARTEPVTKPDGTQVSQEPKMVAICIPPWNLSKLDLQDFATQGTLAARGLDLTPGEIRISKSHILWAIVYEACKGAHCSYFIVTTYDYVVFGNMSKNYTVASVSTVFDFSQGSDVPHMPNLLQLLTYWELASIGIANWSVPLDEDIINRG